MPSKHFIDGRSSFVDGPCRPWPSRRRYCSGASKGGRYIGTYGAPPMSPLRYPAKAKAPRSLIAVSIRLVQRYARARRRTRATVQKPFQRRGEVFCIETVYRVTNWFGTPCQQRPTHGVGSPCWGPLLGGANLVIEHTGCASRVPKGALECVAVVFVLRSTALFR